MFLDPLLSDAFFAEQLQIKPLDRDRLSAWGEQWLLTAAKANPGTWSTFFRPRLESFLANITFEQTDGKIKVVCPPRDQVTFIALVRGTAQFDGVDNLELELLSVFMSENKTRHSKL
jgi:hypothetical protein